MFNRGFTVSGSSLGLLRIGERGVVSGLRNTDETLTRKLRGMGITPGTSITVEQRFPQFIVKVGCDRVVLSHQALQSIYVRLMDSSARFTSSVISGSSL